MKLDRRCTLPVLLLALVACGGEAPVTKPSTTTTPSAQPAAGAAAQVDAQTLARAQTQFDSLCMVCHGGTGHGDGPGAQAIEPKPRSFADPAWQASVTDDHIRKVITLGGAAVGKSPMMPAQPQLKSDQALLNGLVQIVRNFKGK